MFSRKQGTVCFFLNKGKILLFLIEYPDGTRRWNGVGGYVEEDESLENGLAREIKEEIGIKIDKQRLKKELTLAKFDKEKSQEFDLNIYILEDFSDSFQLLDPTIKEFRWFKFSEIPFNQMWEDNKNWLPQMLNTDPLE